MSETVSSGTSHGWSGIVLPFKYFLYPPPPPLPPPSPPPPLPLPCTTHTISPFPGLLTVISLLLLLLPLFLHSPAFPQYHPFSSHFLTFSLPLPQTPIPTLFPHFFSSLPCLLFRFPFPSARLFPVLIPLSPLSVSFISKTWNHFVTLHVGAECGIILEL